MTGAVPTELTEVLRALEDLRARHERGALATIVDVSGSTYRRPGARFLVPERGEPVGNLSGGCLEDTIADEARKVMEEGRPRLLRYDLTADDEAVWGWGLGCNGVIEVFVEPAAAAAEVAGSLRTAVDGARPLAVVLVLEGSQGDVEPGRRLLVDPDGSVGGTTGAPGADEALMGEARRAISRGGAEPFILEVGQGVRAFVEVLEPPPRIVVCGAGHDAIPLVRFAAALGWRPMVVDDRPAFLTPERFPEAAGFVRVEDPAEAAEAVGVDLQTYVVIMSHNYLRDRDYLRSFLESGAAYVGCLGPRGRLERILADLATAGIRPSGQGLARLHGPAGLDLGGEGPEEVAWAIVAEVLAVRNGRNGGPLRDRQGSIHDRSGPR